MDVPTRLAAVPRGPKRRMRPRRTQPASERSEVTPPQTTGSPDGSNAVQLGALTWETPPQHIVFGGGSVYPLTMRRRKRLHAPAYAGHSAIAKTQTHMR